MPRLLLLCEYPTLFGGEMSMLSTLPGVVKAGFEVAVAAPARGALADELRARHVELLPLQAHDGAGHRLPLGIRRAELARALRAHRPDLVHANSLSMGRLSGPVVAELGLLSLSHLRDIVNLKRAAIDDLNCHARLLAVSEATRKHHVLAGIDAAKTRVVYNGVDLTRFYSRKSTGFLHHQLGLPHNAKLVGTIGQISLRKGLDLLLGAASAVVAEVPEVHFLHVGGRFSDKEETIQLEARLRAAATEGRLAGRFHVLGVRRDVNRILPELTLLAHPAEQEPLGRVLLEAAACGVPAVATDVGGTREIFPPDLEAACLVPPGDVRGLAAAMERLIQSAEEARRIGEAARARAEAAFDIRTAAARLVDQYCDVLSRQP